MISVRIGHVEYNLNDLSEDWLHSQVNGRRCDGMPVGVRVSIKTPDIDMVLCTPDEGPSTPGRRPYPPERPVLDLWCSFGLDKEGFSSANVLGFLKRVSDLV